MKCRLKYKDKTLKLLGKIWNRKGKISKVKFKITSHKMRLIHLTTLKLRTLVYQNSKHKSKMPSHKYTHTL